MLDWLFNAPHPLWQWIGLFIGFVALVLSIMAFLYFLLGKPRIYIKYDTEYDKSRQEKYLICQIGNTPVGKCSRLFGMSRRRAEGVHIKFSIQNTKTQKMIATKIQASHTLSIPPSNYPEYSFRVVFAKNEFVKCVGHFNGQNYDLSVGEYLAIVKINTSERDKEYRKRFFIGNEKGDLCWEN